MTFITNLWENVWVFATGFAIGVALSPIVLKALSILWGKLMRNVDQMGDRFN